MRGPGVWSVYDETVHCRTWEVHRSVHAERQAGRHPPPHPMGLVQVELDERGAHLHDGERVAVALQELMRQVLLQVHAAHARALRVDLQRRLEGRRCLQHLLEHGAALATGEGAAEGAQEHLRLHRRRLPPQRLQLLADGRLHLLCVRTLASPADPAWVTHAHTHTDAAAVCGLRDGRERRTSCC
jgi:hypothetical protein